MTDPGYEHLAKLPEPAGEPPDAPGPAIERGHRVEVVWSNGGGTSIILRGFAALVERAGDGRLVLTLSAGRTSASSIAAHRERMARWSGGRPRIPKRGIEAAAE